MCIHMKDGLYTIEQQYIPLKTIHNTFRMKFTCTQCGETHCVITRFSNVNMWPDYKNLVKNYSGDRGYIRYGI